MAPKKTKIPTPEELLEEVSGKSAAKTYPFDDYMQAVHVMQTEKGYSFAKIADFLSERIGGKFTKGQVYRGYQLWLERQAEEALERAQYEADDIPPDVEDDDWTSVRNAEIETLADKAEEFLGELCSADSQFTITADDVLARLEYRARQRAADEEAADIADAKKTSEKGAKAQ